MSTQTRFGLLCLVMYVLIAWSFRFDTPQGSQNRSVVYPFDTFSMYSGLRTGVVSALVFVGADQRAWSVHEFRTFQCKNNAEWSESPCSENHGIPYLFRDLQQYIRNSPGTGTETMKLVTRDWNISSMGPTTQLNDCVIDTCQVSR